MGNKYIEQRNGGYYLTGTRISLDSVVSAFQRGESPERILQAFPLLGKLSRVYGAIAFYLDHQSEIDKYLDATQREFEAQSVPLAQADPDLWKRLQEARAKTGERQV